MTRTLTLILCVALGATQALAFQATPQAPPAQHSTTRLVPVTGVLTDAAGTPLTGPHTIIVTLFDQAEGGTALWTDTLSVAADARGRYAAHLGSGQSLPLEIFHSEQARWLGVTVDGHDLPRTMLAAVPYALKAADADTLGGKPVSSFLTTGTDGKLLRADGTALDGAAVDGSGVPGQIAKWAYSGSTLSSSVISESATNRVGVGLPDPTGGGVVDSVFTIKNYDNNTGLAVLNEANARRFALNTTANGGWLLYDGDNNIWNAGLSQRAGNVGIGTTTQTGKLTVTPAPNFYGIYVNASGTNSVGVRGSTVDGIGIYGAASGTGWGVYGYSWIGFGGYFDGPKTYISGNLGIGTTAPADKLDVAGNIRVGTGTIGCVTDRDGTVIAGNCFSDARFKKNITPFASTLGKLSQLQPVHFDWRAEDFPDRHFGAARSFGLIAQDVEAILPELVVTDAQGFRAVKYSELPLHMLQAIKELKTENDALKQQLLAQTDALKQQLLTQEDRLRRLEALAGK